MKKGVKLGFAAIVVSLALVACKKEECHECHYDGPNGIVELGEKCGDELEAMEATGINVDGVHYEVHCHDH